MDNRGALRIGEAASYVGVSRQTAYNLINSGAWRVVPIGRRGVRVPVDEIDRWMRENARVVGDAEVT